MGLSLTFKAPQQQLPSTTIIAFAEVCHSAPGISAPRFGKECAKAPKDEGDICSHWLGLRPSPFLNGWVCWERVRESEKTLDSLSDRPNNSRHGRAKLWTDSYTHSLAPTSVAESTPAGLTITSVSEMARAEKRQTEGGSCEGWTDAYVWVCLDICVLTGVQSDDRNRKGSCSNVTCSCKNLKKCVSMCFTQKGVKWRIKESGWQTKDDPSALVSRWERVGGGSAC